MAKSLIKETVLSRLIIFQMKDNYLRIIEKARSVIFKKSIKDISIEEFCKKTRIKEEEFKQYFKDKEDLIDKILEHERQSFEVIFDKYDFEGQNAIDIMLIVGMEISKRFKFVNPAVTLDLKNQYPEIYRKHLESRQGFIFEKIKINIEKGIRQGIYRKDISIELIARTYLSKLLDIHDADDFPPQAFSFATLYEIMFEKFITGIANKQGIEYYKKRKQLYKVMGR